MTEKKTATFKSGGTAVGLGVGNGIAYFLIWYGETYKSIVFDDPLLAMAMLGALVSAFLLELKRIGAMIAYVFNRIFPEKKDS
jgi:hypothetical protein